jgi:hypothetical protein
VKVDAVARRAAPVDGRAGSPPHGSTCNVEVAPGRVLNQLVSASGRYLYKLAYLLNNKNLVNPGR